MYGRYFLSSTKGLEFFFLDGDRRPPVLAIESDSFSLLVLGALRESKVRDDMLESRESERDR